MAQKVLLADWSTGEFGLIEAGTVMDTAEPRYTALVGAGAPFAPYDSTMAALVSAYVNQAKILPQGSHVDLTGVLEAGGKIVPPGQGDVVGPAVATDNALVRFDATTGKLIQNSLATLSDAGTLAVPAGQAVTVGGVSRAAVLAIVAVQTGTPVAAAIDQFIPVDATLGVATVNLPTAVGNAGRMVVIKSVAGGNDVVADGNGGQTIDGAATKTILAAATGRDTIMMLISDGANWYSL